MTHSQAIFQSTAILCSALLSAASACAQDYPSKPVRVIVPFATGGGSDITARNMSQKLTGEFNQQFIIDNRPGAGGVVGLETLIKAPADGYTIMISTSSWSTAAALSKRSFDPVSDIAPVIEIGYNPLVLSLHPSVPAKNPRELIALAKARPGQLAYATPGVGAITHLAMELMLHMAKVDLLSVPYKSTGATMTDLIAGRTQLILGGLVPLQPYFGEFVNIVLNSGDVTARGEASFEATGVPGAPPRAGFWSASSRI